MAGNWYFNMHSIGIEHEGFAVEGTDWYSEQLACSGTQWAAQQVLG
ncbi:N-acetylmuramoyl-L-alanine amidase [Neobacillus soli]|nr:N-acetylmuramoyl-L-alanine amidase [Neobacillus soli]